MRPRITRTRLIVWITLAVLVIAGVLWMTVMPDSPVKTPLPELSADERQLTSQLEADVRYLAYEIGERNMHTGDTMDRTAAWLKQRFKETGFKAQRHVYTLTGESMAHYAGHNAVNLVAELPGTQRPKEIVVVGAHYDTVPGSPGANDNATAVAVLLSLAEAFADRPQARTLRFVAFANEEPPFFLGPDMGSHAYALRCRKRGERVTAMMAMDGLGYYSDEPGSQQYPAPGIGLLYPDTANFITFTTRARNAGLLRRALGAFRERASIPSEGAALPAAVPGVGWSDHWAFWQHGYPAFLVTDTLPFRDPYYHTPADTHRRLDYERLARVAVGLRGVVDKLAGQ